MRGDVFSKAFPRLGIQINHLLDAHDVVFDQIHHVAQRGIFRVVIDGDGGIILVPAPVLVPGQTVAEETAVRLLRELRVQVHEIGAFLRHAAHIAGRFDMLRQLHVPDAVVSRQAAIVAIPKGVRAAGGGVSKAKTAFFALRSSCFYDSKNMTSH